MRNVGHWLHQASVLTCHPLSATLTGGENLLQARLGTESLPQATSQPSCHQFVPLHSLLHLLTRICPKHSSLCVTPLLKSHQCPHLPIR